MNHANAKQVGGNHYKTSFEHWDFVAIYGLGYFEGQITKYVARHPKKHKAQDVDKALHFTEKLMELFQAKKYMPTHVLYMPGRSKAWDDLQPSQYFARVNDCGMDEAMIINKMCGWTTVEDLLRVLSVLRAIRAKYTVTEDTSEPSRGYVNQDGPSTLDDPFLQTR
jgi:hypothetical protein